MNRRQVLAAMLLASVTPWNRVLAGDNSRSRLQRIITKANEQNWPDLPIGDLIARIGKEFQGIPYVGGTLEGAGPEQCRVDLDGLDCVTFFEVSLNIARMLKLGGSSMDELKDEITYTRYRGGELKDYASRLHYTAEWISDNVTKGVVKDITPELGGEPLAVDVHFMSQNPKFYDKLKNDPAMVKRIAAIEQVINRIPRTVVPKERIKGIEGRLRSGDIIAVATSKDGLDYAHTGMILRVEGEARFFHASTTKKKVVIDVTVSEYVNSVTSHTGISVVRPQEP